MLLQAQENDGTLQSVIKGDNVVDDAIMQFELAEPYKVFDGLPASELKYEGGSCGVELHVACLFLSCGIEIPSAYPCLLHVP